MALSVEKQLRYWGIAATVFLAILWLLGDVMLPFVLGGAVAYFLDPVADALERWGFNRVWATVTITLAAAIVLVAIALLVVPSLLEQSAALVDAAPEFARNLHDFFVERFPTLQIEDSPIRRSLAAMGEFVRNRGGALFEGLLNSAASLLNLLILIFIAPVVAFYLLLDWDRMVAKVDEMLPRDHAPAIRRIAREIDSTLASFIRGQGTVMLILGAFYATALMLVGLQFGLVVGAFAGLISFIPYVGAILGGAMALGLAAFQFWGEWAMIAAVAAIFFGGQFLEGNFLTPKLVGGSVGLHPVWILLALTVFGSLFGFVGMLVAVPVSAAFGVVVRFAIEGYKKGRLYRGLEWSGGNQEGDDDRSEG